MAETCETYFNVPRSHEIGSPKVCEIRSIGKKLNSAWYLALMNEELHLLKVHKARELQHYLLWVHAEPLTLPSDELALILV
jgi:hypothetical protein